MTVYVIEYKNHKPIGQYTLSGVSAGLEFIVEQEGIWKDRTYRISDRSVLRSHSGVKKWEKR